MSAEHEHEHHQHGHDDQGHVHDVSQHDPEAAERNKVPFYGKRIYAIRELLVEKGVLSAYDVIKPGLKVSELFNHVVETVRREGISHFKRSHIGHGIGVDGYDPPNISDSSGELLEENMVVCIETPYYELGFAGLQVEDMVLVRKNGAQSLMTLPTGLRIV